MRNADTSIWASLRNPTYLRFWSALVVSGCCVSAADMAATWAMNSLGTSDLWLSLISSAATLPFFLFTLPAGALGDLADRRRLLCISSGWLACSAGLLACDSVNESRGMNTSCGRNSGLCTSGKQCRPQNTTWASNTGDPKNRR